MEWGLAIDVFAVDVDLFVGEKRDCVVDVAVIYRMEHYRVAHLLDAANHLLKLLQIISLLFLAPLFALLFFAAWLKPVSLPYFLDVLVVLFFCYLFRWRQNLHNISETILMRPVASCETLCVLNIFNVL